MPDLPDLIREAFSPDRFEACGRQLVTLLTEHLRNVMSGTSPVQNWRPPPANIADASAWLDSAPAGSDHDRFATLVREMLDRGQNLHHPHYIGHQVPGSAPLAALFDFVGAVTNQVMAVYEMGPWATAVERALIERLGARFGLMEGTFSGVVTHGGSLANLTALLTARNVMLPGAWEQGSGRPGRPPMLVVQSDAHYGIARSAGILGLGTRQIVRIPLDAQRRMDVAALDQTLTNFRTLGQPIVAVVACSGATPTGAFDPLEPIADVCERHRVWLHVDAAHGGGAIFSERNATLLSGLNRADSFICDAHKMLFVPALCAFVFYRQREHRFAAFQQDAPYLFDPTAPGDTAEFDSGLTTLECTKRSAAYGLWGLWSLFGPDLFGQLVDHTFGLAHRFWELLAEASDFTPLHEPQGNIVCFRYVPTALRRAPIAEVGRYNQVLRRRLLEAGQYYIVQTTLNEAPALRTTFMNPLTTEADLQGLLEAIREAGRSTPPSHG
ncbi:MAG: pyridoxal phosphate-dependent decarboxylase family protein [Planctomycetaceae bacterium]